MNAQEILSAVKAAGWHVLSSDTEMLEYWVCSGEHDCFVGPGYAHVRGVHYEVNSQSGIEAFLNAFAELDDSVAPLAVISHMDGKFRRLI